jgi:polysaccharide pyruvyl transferase WcaK-like protein
LVPGTRFNYHAIIVNDRLDSPRGTAAKAAILYILAGAAVLLGVGAALWLAWRYGALPLFRSSRCPAAVLPRGFSRFKAPAFFLLFSPLGFRTTSAVVRSRASRNFRSTGRLRRVKTSPTALSISGIAALSGSRCPVTPITSGSSPGNWFTALLLLITYASNGWRRSYL